MSDLQVEVDGQETFSVSMKILASFSGKLRNMFGESEAEDRQRSLKLIFHGFPGGAEGFELIVRFCYNGGRIFLAPSNVVLLHSAAKYLDIQEVQTAKYIESVHFWTWSELLDCLKQCQEFMSFMSSSSVFQEILNAVVETLSMHHSSSPFALSCSDFSSTQFSGDISTFSSSRFSSFHTSNWLRDLEFLNTELFDKVLNTMIYHKLDHGMVCSFLLHYQKMRFINLLPAEEKCRITEVVIKSLSSLDGGFWLFPFRSLCDMLQACLTLKMGKSWVKKAERMIGSRLDEATLDDLMIPSHGRKAWAYDVNIILMFLKIFLWECRKNLCVRRLRRVGFLMDLYLAEVAPDPHLSPLKFLALALALPDSARENHDSFCEAILLYFKVHRFMSEEEKIRICSVLNADKLSNESLVNLANDAEFPAGVAASAMVILQSKLKTLANNDKNCDFRWSSWLSADEDEQVEVHLSEGKECRKVQKILCSKSSLPRLCS